MTPTLKDRVCGCLLAGALGDAWGGSYEGAHGPLQFGIPEHSHLSDDTQLTLATCESIFDLSRVAPANIAAHFLRWFSTGRLSGLGSSTLKALRDLRAGTHWALAGAQGEYSAGNGAAMRIAPLAFLLDPHLPGDRSLIRDVCRITHHNDEAYIGALAVILAIQAVLSGTWSGDHTFLDSVVNKLPDSSVRDRAEQLLPLHISPIDVAGQFGASGYVVDTVPLALYCAQNIANHSIESVLTSAIACGGDTDTIASITGQIAGTVAGASAIRADHMEHIEGRQQIADITEKFAEFVSYRNQKL
jgi:ADP-ribosylglycohydrolase